MRVLMMANPNQKVRMGQKIPLADELSPDHLIDLGHKLDEIRDKAESLNLTKTGMPGWQVRMKLDFLRLSVLEAMAILDGNPR